MMLQIGENGLRLMSRLAPALSFAAMTVVAAAVHSQESSAGEVYRCELNGKVTYTDAPCEKAAKRKRVETTLPNTYSSESADASKKSASNGESQAVQSSKCQQIIADLIKARSQYFKRIQSANEGNSHLSEVMADKKEVTRLEEASKKSKCHF